MGIRSDIMKDSKVIIIDKFSNIIPRGNLDDFRHSITLLNYIKEAYPNWQILKSLDYTVAPLILGTVLVYAKNIVFLNTTKNNILSGIILFGKEYDTKQIATLKRLIQEFDNYNIKIISDLELVDGEAIGKDYYLQPNEHASDMFERFLREKELEKDAGLHK